MCAALLVNLISCKMQKKQNNTVIVLLSPFHAHRDIMKRLQGPFMCQLPVFFIPDKNDTEGG